MTETWCPEIGDKIRCISNEYSQCEERAAVGQHGTVYSFWDVGGHKTRRVMVVQFDVSKRNIPTHPKKTVFFEYFCLERGAYLYFEPVRG